ncbi:IS66 family insertion sequence element accessory protein TnpB, partial [Alteromonas sp. IB21]|uniref:IS66 family insertion sequence element accessory protein TnpB n=1 Tax=Alteromonas sp. IB21 TaxID=2779369 RepID=UPI0018E7B3C4
MKMFVEPADIYLYMDVVDFRKSINGLIVVVEQDMNLNPFRDALFVFCNKKRDKVKMRISVNPIGRFGFIRSLFL